MSEEKEKIKCYRCTGSYSCPPWEHQCPDGTTFKQRCLETSPYPISDDLVLTADDRKLLRGMKIKIE